ncbi:succinate dehydrogenase assembly factor 2 [Paracoccus pacificus]|uniref:FAD assembly factor SdhE n=1 Tax=Paracoccus pacificus TaxID=1463598 RepID=A0ABW4RC29_9RHOB
MRSRRRGMKEMDVILGNYASRRLIELSGAELDEYELLLAENDQDLYMWILARSVGRPGGPETLQPALDRIVKDLSSI